VRDPVEFHVIPGTGFVISSATRLEPSTKVGFGSGGKVPDAKNARARRETIVAACMVTVEVNDCIWRKPLDDMDSGKEKRGDVIQRSDRPPGLLIWALLRTSRLSTNWFSF
jgi:hypothetical protein